MRKLLVFVVLAGGLWAVDMIAFKGQYTKALWIEANYQGQSLRYAVDRGLRNLNF